MWFFIDLQTTLECVLISFVFAWFLAGIALHCLAALQSFGYKNRALLKWLGVKGNLAQARLSVLSICCALCSAVFGLCFSFVGRWSAVISLAGFIIFFALYLYASAKQGVKISFSLTPRFKRLLITLYLVLAVLVYLACTLLNFADAVWGLTIFTALRYCPLAIFPVTLTLIICLAALIAKIWEKPIAKHYIKKAKNKLAAAKLQVVGITGSYAKTSAKNILFTMLSKKYRVLATPSSYNTPLGVAKTLNGAKLEDFDIFIAEMGARRNGDIAELCGMCPPDYSLITGICPQHLASFKTIENVISAKGEIISATAKKCLISPSAFNYFKHMQGANIAEGCLSGVTADSTGTAFTLNLGGKSYAVKTKLLGAHSAENIALCAMLAFEMGVAAEDIVTAAEELDFVEHRLQLIVSGGVNIIDDGYNSNPVGAKAAVEVLKSFGGKRVCVTPGIVELGVLEESENAALGRELVGLDYIVLVGETLVRAVQQGYTEAGGDPEKITVVPTLAAAQDILKGVLQKGDTVLFLNDLPAQYL